MASLIFEVLIEEVNDRQIKFIRDVIEKRGFVDNKVVFRAVGAAGDNFASNIKRITVKVDDGEDFVMIAKLAPSFEQLRSFFNPKILFDNEIVVYMELFSKFKNLEETANVPHEERLKYAECYGYLSEEPYELILLEDLILSEYTMLNKSVPLDYEHMIVSLKTLAFFHALSYALKKSDFETYERIKNKLTDIVVTMKAKSEGNMVLVDTEANLIKLTDNEEFKSRIKGTITKWVEMNEEIGSDLFNNKLSVIQHGDVWTNNILFKYKNDEVSECIMIDYQQSKESHPACDILNLILNCTGDKSMVKYYYAWIDCYYEQLTKSLCYYGINAVEFYPKDKLHEDLKKVAKYTIGQALFAASMTSRDDQDANAMKDNFALITEDITELHEAMTITKLTEKSSAILKSRVENIVSSCIELNLI